MIEINIKTIPHSAQRYETVGDWWIDPDASWQIRISKLNDWRYEVLVAVHEVSEMAMCMAMGVGTDEVDEFDKAFEATRRDGDTSEPGDDPRAPYRVQHCIATGIERVLAAMLGVSWKEYDDAINAL